MPAAPDCNRPVTVQEADRLFGVLEGLGCLALGVSGGPDSIALLYLVADWSRRRNFAPALCVFTVDHGLRREAQAEAYFVKDVCVRLGIRHEILPWNEPRPGPGVQASARAARMDLISEAARKVGAEAIVLAHHLDDQAETFLQRLQRGSGVYGLAAMRGRDEWHGLQVVRPLLAVPKSRLIATLEAAGQDWCEDPSNEDATFSRVRWRQLMPALAREGLTATRLAQTAERMARAAEALDQWVDSVLEMAVVHPAGPVRVEIRALVQLPAEIRYRALARLVRFAGGSLYVPRLEKLERAVDDLLTATAHKRTLGGTVMYRQGDHLFVWRETGRLGLQTLRLEGPGEVIWDNRFRLWNRRQGAISIAPLGMGMFKQLGIAKPTHWPGAAFACAPMLVTENDEIFVPGVSDASGLEGCGLSPIQSLLTRSAGKKGTVG